VHELRFAREGRPKDVGPRCRHCARSVHVANATCKRRDCPGYVGLWMGDQGVRLLENLLAYDGKVAMLTVTAPGADELPFDTALCTTEGPHKCSGRIGCRVNPAQARRFNEQSMRAWSQLWAAVRSAIYREHGPGALKLLAYAPEAQARGVIHFHAVLGAKTAVEYAAMVAAARHLQRLAGGYGWGFVDTNPVHGQLREAGAAAAYVSKYMLRPDKAGGVRELVTSGQAPRRAVYVATSLTARTRCTMRNLRARRLVYAATGERGTCAEVERFMAQWARYEREATARRMWKWRAHRRITPPEKAIAAHRAALATAWTLPYSA
jgi:hypothetical protein